MAISETREKYRPITGFANIDYREASKKGGEIVPVTDPTVPYEYGTSARASMLANNNSATMEDVQKGWSIDSYIRQGVVKYSENLVKEGYTLKGKNPDAVAYVRTRLNLMTFSTGTNWWKTFMGAIRDYVKFGNAFLIKSRMKAGTALPGMKRKGMMRTKGVKEKPPVGGYYRVSPLVMKPVLDDEDRLVKWQQNASGAKEKPEFDLDDVLHWTYDQQSGSIWGVSLLLPVLDDVRALRQVEEMVIELVFKSLNPLFHHEVPDTTGTGLGQQKDVTKAASEYDIMAVNGYLVTPPGHKLQVLGVESKALRAEGYLRFLRQRVYAGLGLSELVMGEAEGGLGTAEGFASVMHDHIRFCQREISDYITYGIVWELLLEGGFNPLFDEADQVFWEFNEVDIDRRIKEEGHTALKWTQNLITLEEARADLDIPEVVDESGLYVNKVQIPQKVDSPAAPGDASGNSNLTGGDNKTPNKKKAPEAEPSSDESIKEDFIRLVRSRVVDYVKSSYASKLTPAGTEAVEIVIASADELEKQYGPLPYGYVEQLKTGINHAFESAGSSTPAHLLSKLHSWLDVSSTL